MEVGVEVGNELVGAGVLPTPEQPATNKASPKKTQRDRSLSVIRRLLTIIGSKHLGIFILY